MNNKKKRRSSKTTRVDGYSKQHGMFVFLGLIAFVMLLFHLWGKVEIDLVLRENDQLEQKRVKLQREVDELKVQINTKKRYQRIVPLANKQGMRFLSAEDVTVLNVDLSGLGTIKYTVGKDLKYAGFEPIGLRWERRRMSTKKGKNRE